MPVNAKDVLNSEMLRYVASPVNDPFLRKVRAAKGARAYDRQQERLEYARRMFPNVHDREALEMLREWEYDHR